MNHSHVLAACAALAATLAAQDPSMVRGIGWRSETIFTVGQTFNGYTPPGILDGTAAFPTDRPGRALILVNHELNPGNGYAYELANGVQLPVKEKLHPTALHSLRVELSLTGLPSLSQVL